MHLALPFQSANMLYMYLPLEEALQNEAVSMKFSVDSHSTILSHIQIEVNVIHKLDCH